MFYDYSNENTDNFIKSMQQKTSFSLGISPLPAWQSRFCQIQQNFYRNNWQILQAWKAKINKTKI